MIMAWLQGLFTHPKTTLGGIGSLLGAAALGYGMSTGSVPINAQSIATIGGLASAGFAGLTASDATGTVLTNTIDTAAAGAGTADRDDVLCAYL